ncbi:DNA-3-methyladenine glycosylase I [Acholeplasma hippikon]|uniref:DNA-3-methyladenine glycosylase 1 n=1 Tax=Acholeplasma hippikon TaxID=264636 RepID=A0A449BKV6_9MOLU|nr:DNA-3-methyladenine glycosylase I [Acholeplasma hippikon]VEU83064.1 DNA-3-methyladenine glycosylase 1 [Acholeplasma hippikon]
MERCAWANQSETEKKYHDELWGKPLYDSKALFKMLILESQQAGLSWITILNKWEAFEDAYDHFDPDKIIHYDDAKINELMNNTGIIRNRMKIDATIHNAKMYFNVEKKYGSFSDFIWSFVDYKPIINHYQSLKEVPATTPISDKLSKALKKEGFKFLGPTTVYAFMQAVGMVNDHMDNCFCK